jgi:TolB-like protein
MTNPHKAVFLSYASQDAEAAKRICDALRAADIEVWFDQSELRGGDVWDRQIRQQIHDCRLFMPIVSANTEARAEGYFRREWKLAVDRTHDLSERVAFLVPIAIDSTPEPMADVPDAFRHIQWTRLPDGNASSAFIDRIRRLITQVPPSALPTAMAPAEYKPAQISAATNGPHRVARVVLWTLSGVVALGLVYFVADRFWLSKHTSAERPVAAALPAPPPAMPPIPEKSVAVLPFVDMSEKKDQEYFSDGLSEELIDMLTKLTDLRVPARTSSFYFKGKQSTIADIAKVLRVAHVLEGSVRKSGKHLRITAQLVRVEDGYHVWSETYDRQVDDIFKVQDDIATAVVKALKVSLLEGDIPKVTTARNADAYALFLQGRATYRQAFDDSTLAKAIAYLRDAVNADPAFAEAWAQLAIALQYAARESELPDHTALMAEAVRAAEHAMSLNPNLGEAHRARGSIYYSQWNWTQSLTEDKRALQLDPDNAEVARNLAEVMSGLRVDDALTIRLYGKSIDEDPLNAYTYASLSGFEIVRGEYREAEIAARKAINLSGGGLGHDVLASIFLLTGRATAALSEITQIPDTSSRNRLLPVIYHALGRMAESDALLHQLERTSAASDAYTIAGIHAYRGEADQAFDWLDRAYLQHDDGLTYFNRDPFFRNIQADPRYKAFLRKMNLPE